VELVRIGDDDQFLVLRDRVEGQNRVGATNDAYVVGKVKHTAAALHIGGVVSLQSQFSVEVFDICDFVGCVLADEVNEICEVHFVDADQRWVYAEFEGSAVKSFLFFNACQLDCQRNAHIDAGRWLSVGAVGAAVVRLDLAFGRTAIATNYITVIAFVIAEVKAISAYLHTAVIGQLVFAGAHAEVADGPGQQSS
jgi:hypothetical protein